jgi:hypothetical protein
MTIQKFPTIVDKSTDNVVPVLSVKIENGEIIEAEVWIDDDIYTLEKGEFEVIDRYGWDKIMTNEYILRVEGEKLTAMGEAIKKVGIK